MNRLRRPSGGDRPEFDLIYVRTGPRTSSPPLVVIPGGPGLASVVPYIGFRRRAARLGPDVIMIEHRGVGRSRTDIHSRDLPPSAMWISEVVDDIAAVLDRESVETALFVGSSYGSYLAATFGARHSGRVAGMLLDSALQSAEDGDLERHAVRSLFWEADTALAADVRQLCRDGVDDRILLDVVRAAYELGGAELTAPLVRARVGGRGTLAWRLMEAYATRGESLMSVPGVYKFELAGVIGFRELGYGGRPDGLPLDPALAYAPLRGASPTSSPSPRICTALRRNSTGPWCYSAGAEIYAHRPRSPSGSQRLPPMQLSCASPTGTARWSRTRKRFSWPRPRWRPEATTSFPAEGMT